MSLDTRRDTGAKAHLRLWLCVLKLQRRVEAELRERLRVEFGTTLPRFDVMAALARRPAGLKMSELSRMLMVSNGNVTGIVDRLAEDGLVRRETVEGDRRAARVRLTATGQTEFDRQAQAHAGWIRDLLGGLDATEAAILTRSLSPAIPQKDALP